MDRDTGDAVCVGLCIGLYAYHWDATDEFVEINWSWRPLRALQMSTKPATGMPDEFYIYYVARGTFNGVLVSPWCAAIVDRGSKQIPGVFAGSAGCVELVHHCTAVGTLRGLRPGRAST